MVVFQTMIKVLAISGSLRSGSSNTALLQAASLISPSDIDIHLFEGLGALSYYSPDFEDNPPPAVQDFRTVVSSSHGLVFSTPEYAHGLPGVLKNSLDWLVGGPEFMEKPFVLFNASDRGKYAQANLIETLTIMSGRLVESACLTIPLIGKPMSADEIANDTRMASILRSGLEAFASHLRTLC